MLSRETLRSQAWWVPGPDRLTVPVGGGPSRSLTPTGEDLPPLIFGVQVTFVVVRDGVDPSTSGFSVGMMLSRPVSTQPRLRHLAGTSLSFSAFYACLVPPSPLDFGVKMASGFLCG
jgi:hypothetical protein